jgi:hypothetical protein
MRWERHVARVGEKKAYELLVGNPEGKDTRKTKP